MESLNRELNEFRKLRVVSSSEEHKAYFLSNFPSETDLELLDFIWEKKGRSKARITFSISKAGEAISLPQAPFGGFWTESYLSSSSLEAFILAIVEELSRRSVNSISITQAPKPYESQVDLIHYLLFKNGFQQTKILSHHIFRGKNKIKKLVLNETEKILEKCNTSGLKISHTSILNFDFLKEINSWSIQKGYEITIDEKRMVRQVLAYPDRYFLITIAKNEEAIGYALAVKLTCDSMYYFLSAMNPKIPLSSGGDLILHELFTLAAEQKVKFIDLGSSDLDAGPNHSLMFFKSRFSNDISNKITWVKKI